MSLTVFSGQKEGYPGKALLNIMNIIFWVEALSIKGLQRKCPNVKELWG